MNKNRNRVLFWGCFVALMLGWHAAIRIWEVQPLVFPAPLDVAASLWQGLVGGELWPHLGVTMYEILAGFFAGAAIGFVLGALIAQVAVLEAVLYPYVVAFQTLPKVALAPLCVVWFGFGVTSKVVITATVVFFPVLVNTIAGLRAASTDQVDLLVSCCATRWQIFRMAQFPQALPYIFAGLDIGIVLAVIGALVGEFVGAQAGLGYLILQRNSTLDTPGVFAILIVLSLIGVALHGAMKLVSRKLVFWQ
jgi:NitT/TauT family transport system permease protein